MKIDPVSIPVFPQPIIREETSAKNKREIPTGSLYTGPGNNNDDRVVRPDVRTLRFTADARGEGYPTLEKQIAGQMIRQREGQSSESGFTASYGAPYEARKSLLAYGLAAAGIHDPADLPADWYKQPRALADLQDSVRGQYAASARTHFDAQGNAREPTLLVAAARDFFDQQINTGAQYKTNTQDAVPGLEGKALAHYSDQDKVQALRHFAGQPLRTEQNEPSNAELFMKDIGTLLVLDGLAADAGAMAELFSEEALASEGAALAGMRSAPEEVLTEEAGTEAGIGAEVNRLRPSLAGDIRQYALQDGEALLKESRAGAGGIHQVKDAAGNDRWLLRYRGAEGESQVYEVSPDFRAAEGRARIIDPATRKPVLTVESAGGEWQRSGLPGGINPQFLNAPAQQMYGNPRAGLAEARRDVALSRPTPMDVDSQPGSSTSGSVSPADRPLDLSLPRSLPDSRASSPVTLESSLPPTPATPVFDATASRSASSASPFSPALSEEVSTTGLPRTPGASLFGEESKSPSLAGASPARSTESPISGLSSRSSSPASVVTSGAEHSPYADNGITVNPWAPTIQLPSGSYLNDRGYIERADFTKLYRVEKNDRVARRGDPQEIGFRDGNYFAGVEKMMSGPVVFVARTREGAERFGRGEFGGVFHLYEIDAKGIPGVSLRENVEHNEHYMELANTTPPGYIAGLREKNRLERFGDYAWSFDEVHLANNLVTPDKITKIY
ncbi:hypothetical protein [Kosakonia pseudosacchari]|uniref:hypothetical protein n=1 Tax=Kosakonia pseudosacchari TaxID=1646340 RepID=UPI00188180B1|nr:hypothetical protein [Kosakonia pseudosacchari]QOV64068.1 hypothetical protein IP581_23025 [Kosakonia pseudosacchari]